MYRLEDNFKSFDEYVMKFDLNEPAIKRKYDHSYRVMNNCGEISTFLNLSKEGSYLATLIGLLHDIGRFEQWTKYKTFSDYNSINHAVLGAKILFDDNLISAFKADKKDYELIKKSIINHNAYELNKGIDNRELLFSNIIRDADKIDIIHQISEDKVLRLDEDDSEITGKVKEEFYNHECINKKYKRTRNDNVILKIALVYGLNFDYSRELVLQKNYLDKMLDSLSNKEKFKEYTEEAKKCLKRSVNNVR